MKKQGLTNLILRVCSAVVAVFAFIGMAFKFAFTKMDSAKAVPETFKDWVDGLKAMGKAPAEMRPDYYSTWSAARVFMIIALVLVAIVAVIAIVQLFWNHKYLTYALWTVAGLTVVCAVIFLILFAVGGGQIVDSVKPLKMTVGPREGALFIGLCPIIASALAVVPTFLKSKNA